MSQIVVQHNDNKVGNYYIATRLVLNDMNRQPSGLVRVIASPVGIVGEDLQVKFDDISNSFNIEGPVLTPSQEADLIYQAKLRVDQECNMPGRFEPVLDVVDGTETTNMQELARELESKGLIFKTENTLLDPELKKGQR